ncbi:MAG: zf-HC2 domain-containing protein, partial [Anaerolineales bacterium]
MPELKPNQHPDEITLDVYLDHELPDHQALQIEAHLRECEQCRDYIQQRQVFFTLIAEAEQVSISSDVSLRVIEVLRAVRLRVLAGVLSLEAVLAAVLLILFTP